MRKVMLGLAVVAAMAVVSQQAVAQANVRPIRFGVQGNFATNNYGPGVGARVVYNGLATTLKVPGLGVYGSFDYFFPSTSHFGSGAHLWEINANATYDVKLGDMPTIAPYVGAGLNYAHLSYDCTGCSGSETGLNLLGGARFNVTPQLNAFGEVRIEIRTGSAVVFTAGVLF